MRNQHWNIKNYKLDLYPRITYFISLIICLSICSNCKNISDKNIEKKINEIEDIGIVKSVYLSDFYNAEFLKTSSLYPLKVKLKKEIFIKNPDTLHFKTYEISADSLGDMSYVLVFYGRVGKFGFLLNRHYTYPNTMLAYLEKEVSIRYKDRIKDLPCMVNALQYLCKNENFFLVSDTSLTKTSQKLSLFLSCVFDSSGIGNLISVENYNKLKNDYKLFTYNHEFFETENKNFETKFLNQLQTKTTNVNYVRIGNQILRFQLNKAYFVNSFYFEIRWIDTRVNPLPSAS
jgi:hypothetical protein